MSDSPYDGLNRDGDDDSLFGSPPPSPSRGRSPSPLAFPSGTAQNVGTLALPGSHLVAELPVTPPASLPLNARASTSSQHSLPTHRPTPSASQSRIPFQSIGSSARRNSAGPSRVEPVQRSRKGKERERARAKSATPRPTPPPIPLPPVDEPPPPNFFRNQQALLGLAGMVGGINPANLSKQRYTRGTTAQNPIVVEDEPQQPSIGKRPLRSGLAESSQLPRPTSEQILGTLLQQKNVFPVVVSLLRLLVPGAPSLAPTPPNFAPLSLLFDSRSQSPESSGSSSATGMSAPPLKRRRLNKVPAGAGDWDVPYPFQEGQGPENYRSTWERERGKQVLADLVQLVRGAAHKAAAKAWYQQYNYGPQPTVNKYYRPKTMYYGLERGPAAQSRAQSVQPRSGTSEGQPSGASTPRPNTSSSNQTASLSNTPCSGDPQSYSDPSHISSAAFDHLVESLLAAQQQQEQHSSTPSEHPASDDATAAATGFASTPSPESTQALFDSWLDMLAAIPPPGPNDSSADSPLSCTTPASSFEPTPDTSSFMANPDPSSQIPDYLIDPSLLNLTVNTGGNTAPPSSTSPLAGVEPSSAKESSSTPSLVDSPTATAISLTDSADAGPATPSWDWAFPDTQEGPGPSQQDMKLLEQWAGMDMAMDVDVDALIREQVAATHPAEAPGADPAPVPAAAGLGPASSPADSAGSAADGSVSAAAAQVDGTGAGAERISSLSDPTLSLCEPGPDLQPLPAQDPQPPVDVNAQVLLQQIASAAASPSPSPLSPSAGAPQASQDGSGTEAPLGGLGAACDTLLPQPVPAQPAQALASVTPAFTPALAPRPALASAPAARATATATAKAKGKAKALPCVGAGVASAFASASAGTPDRKAILGRARAMRAALVAEVERAKVALWETTLEQGVLVAMGRELEKAG